MTTVPKDRIGFAPASGPSIDIGVNEDPVTGDFTVDLFGRLLSPYDAWRLADLIEEQADNVSEKNLEVALQEWEKGGLK